MKRLTILVFVCLGLAGCDTQEVVKVNKMIVAMPPQRYFNCPLTGLPKQFTTNDDVARLLVQVVHDNRTCNINMTAIHNYLLEAQSKIK